ncbi:SRPBCC family protein [Nonomuraea sp. M3C6]|uniref:SRPBCC family protein n=1 Tax=Nonomuraea marmarensis TaxID=3351344 RepID=A0ABW7AQ17_9ACTN
MATTSASIDLPVPAEQVWRLIGGFGSLPDWLPYIPASDLAEGGRVRRLTSKGGDVIVERLETFDERARTYTYSFVQSPFPVTGYRSTLAVREAPGHPGCRVEWSGSFTPVGATTDDEAIALFHGIYADGLAALQQALGT